MTEKSGTFLVTHAEPDSAVLQDVDGGQVHTLAENPGVEEHDVIEGSLTADPPMEVTWRVVEVETRRRVRIETSEESPTVQERDIAVEQGVGGLTRRERAGKGEIHVLTVPPEKLAEAIEDVRGDPGTLERAARIPEVERVEIRSEVRDGVGVLAVRYLP